MVKNDDYIILDDVIPKGYQDAIVNNLFGIGWDWNYMKDVTAGNHTDVENPAPAFQHHLYQQTNGFVDYYHYFFMPLLFSASEKLGYKLTDVYNGRTFLQTPLPNRKKLNLDPWHIDIPIPHMVMLYYVVDNDACTILSDKKYVEGKTEQLLYPHEMGNFESIKVQPKKGRMLVFNGELFHTAEIPHKDTRCVINYDVALG